ncbi:MAG TPA: SpoIIE family protein phosphatase [Streptosporangiaceae bacterium]
MANVLRDIADERMVTIRSLAARMPYERTKISQSLNGSTRPEWSFIEAFIAACTGSDQIARAVLERKIRPLWEAASPGRARPLAEVTVARGEAAHAAVPPESRAWVSAMHDAAHTQNVVVRLQQSVNRHQDLAEGLMGMMDRLTYAIEKLTAERDTLRAELHSLAGLADDLRLTRQRLEDTQQRLRMAEQLQAETSKRLDEALHQLKEGERIKREALARLDRTRQRLVALEQHAGGAIGSPETDPDPEDAIPTLMGETDQHIAAEILRQVDDVLDEEAANLDELRAAVGDPSARPPERRALPVGRGTDNAATGADSIERYRSLVEASSQVVWVTDENGRVTEDALAVERARLFEREHRTAETLQHSLLPGSLPQLPGIQLAARYHPATRYVQVGGDWYDAFGLPDGRLAIAVGDVMGKGVLAVAGMGRVRNALRALALNDPRPAAVLSGLDRLFSATENEEQFTTVAYGVIALNTGEGVFSNAGHPPPLMLVGKRVALLGDGEPGTPLGWPSQRRQTSFSVSPGNAVVFYSDGLVENRRRGLDAGLDELVKVAADASPDVVADPERLVDYLVRHMLADYERDDDLTVLAARRL